MDHVALVTGAAQGLGRIIAGRLHDAGYKVVITDRDLALARQAAAELDPLAGRVLALELDVTRKADFEAALAAVLKHWGQLHVLVNNAAMTRVTPVMAITADEFDAVMAVNLRGTLFGCQVMGAHLPVSATGA